MPRDALSLDTGYIVLELGVQERQQSDRPLSQVAENPPLVLTGSLQHQRQRSLCHQGCSINIRGCQAIMF
jgi:hypothetical protein